MHSILFVASMPKQAYDWQVYLQKALPIIKPAKGVVRLAENVWLLDVRAGLEAWGSLVAIASERGIAFGALPFHDAPEWLPADFDPSTIQVQSEGVL